MNDNKKSEKGMKHLWIVHVFLFALAGVCDFFVNEVWTIAVWGLVFILILWMEAKSRKASEMKTKVVTQELRTEKQRIHSLLSVIKSSTDQIEEASKSIANKIKHKDDVSDQILEIFNEVSETKENQIEQVVEVQEQFNKALLKLGEMTLFMKDMQKGIEDSISVYEFNNNKAVKFLEESKSFSNDSKQHIQLIKGIKDKTEHVQLIAKAIKELVENVDSLNVTQSNKHTQEMKDFTEKAQSALKELVHISNEVIEATTSLGEKVEKEQKLYKEHEYLMSDIMDAFGNASHTSKQLLEESKVTEEKIEEVLEHSSKAVKGIEVLASMLDEQSFNSQQIENYIEIQKRESKEAIEDKTEMDEAIVLILDRLKRESQDI